MLEVRRADPVAREACDFYHSMNLPTGEEVVGQWDLRADPAEYLGYVPFAGRSVLEIGPASGFLSFYMEMAGASVTCVEPSLERLWDFIPLQGFDLPTWRAAFVQNITRVRNSFWYCHQLYNSSVRVMEAEPYALPDTLGRFDIGVITCVLLHTRSPFSLLESLAGRVSDTIVVTEAYNPALGTEPVCRFLPAPAWPQVHTWWEFTPQFFTAVLATLGFPHSEISFHTQRAAVADRDMDMFTVVARR